MTILETLRKDMFEARKNGLVDKANILGMAIASVNNFKIEVQRDLTEDDVIAVLRKEEKKLKDAYEQYMAGGMLDAANIEKAQLECIQTYLPSLMSQEDVEKFVSEKVASMGDVTVRDMGRIMGSVMQDLKGKADGNIVSSAVKKALGL